MKDLQVNDILTSLGNGREIHIHLLYWSIFDNFDNCTSTRRPRCYHISFPAFFKQACFRNSFGPDKTLVSFSSLEKQIPSAFSASTAQNHAALPSSIPRDFSYHFSRCSDSRGHIPLLYSRKTFRTCRPLFPADGTGHARSGGSMAEEQLRQDTLSPAEPSGEGCVTTGGARVKRPG